MSISTSIYQDCLKICIGEPNDHPGVLHCQIADGKYVISDVAYGFVPARWISTVEDPLPSLGEQNAVGKVLVFETGDDPSRNLSLNAANSPSAAGSGIGPDYLGHRVQARRFVDTDGNLHFVQMALGTKNALNATIKPNPELFPDFTPLEVGSGYDNTCVGFAYPDTTANFEPPGCCEGQTGYWANKTTNASLSCEHCQDGRSLFAVAPTPHREAQCPEAAPYIAACNGPSVNAIEGLVWR